MLQEMAIVNRQVDKILGCDHCKVSSALYPPDPKGMYRHGHSTISQLVFRCFEKNEKKMFLEVAAQLFNIT